VALAGVMSVALGTIGAGRGAATAAAPQAPPGRPHALVATSDANVGPNVHLAWTAAAGAVTGYYAYVFYAGAATRSYLGSTASTSFDTSCDLSSGCFFEVTAYNASGEGLASNRVAVGGDVPAAPQSLQASADLATSAVTLSWQAPVTGAPTGYYVYTFYAGSGWRNYVGSTTSTSFPTACTLSSGCSWEVAGYNAAGEGLPSNRVYAGGEVPSAARTLKASVNALTSEVRLSWAAPASGSPSGYYVSVIYAGDPHRYYLGSTAARTFSTSCALSLGCSFEVAAYNAAGISVASNRAAVGGEAPSPPRSLAVSYNGTTGAASLTWSPPTTGPVAGYYVYIWFDGDPYRYYLGSTATPGFETSCSVGSACAFVAIAYNAGGESAESNRAFVGSPGPGPSDPGPPSVQTSGTGSISLSPDAGNIRWERQVGIKPWSATSSTTTCPDIAAGCKYRLIGVGASGNLVTSPVSLAAVPPSKPRAVKATRIGSTDVQVSWSAPSASGGFDVSYYRLERQAVAAFTSRPSRLEWTEVTTVDAPTRTALVTCPHGEQGATCPFRVTAYTSAGASLPANAMCSSTPPAGADVAASCTWDHTVGDGGFAPTGVDLLPYGSVGVLERAIQDGTAGTLATIDACSDATDGVTLPLAYAACFPTTDGSDPYWYPQGIATNHDAGGWWPYRNLVLASWYKRLAPDKPKTSVGTRLSVIDWTSQRYVHLPLLYMDCTGTCTPTKLTIHAGGIAQAGHYLYVVDTNDGFWVYDLDIVSMVNVDGLVQPSLIAVGHHERTSGNLSFSSVDVDTTMAAGGIGSLLVTEYCDSNNTADCAAEPGHPVARVVRFPLGPSGLIGTGGTGGAASAIDELRTVDRTSGRDISNLQGGSNCVDRLLLNRSDGDTRNGTLFRSAIGLPATDIPWLVGPEDLACGRWWGSTPLVWTLGEHPGKRAIVAVGTDSIEAWAPS
jgi:hypothetical protein